METIKALDAVILIVKDIEKQKRFYRDILGLAVLEDYGDCVFFRVGSQKLALFTRDHHPQGTARLEGASKGISHLEFRIARKDDAPLKRRLNDAGHHAYEENFEDADGNLFHFNSDE